MLNIMNKTNTISLIFLNYCSQYLLYQNFLRKFLKDYFYMSKNNIMLQTNIYKLIFLKVSIFSFTYLVLP